jgi:hypothetical protein
MNLREQILRDEAMALYVGCSLEVMKASGYGAINGRRARTTSKLLKLRQGDPFWGPCQHALQGQHSNMLATIGDFNDSGALNTGTHVTKIEL